MLIQLQALDLKRAKEKEALAQTPEKIKTLEMPLLEARAVIEKSQASYEQIDKERKDKELALQLVEDKIRKLKGRLTELKTNKEYHAHLQEIAVADKEKEETEDRLLMAMENSDLLKKELILKQAALEEAEAQFSRDREDMKAETDRLAESEKKLTQEWDALAKRITPEWMESYNKLCSLRKGLAVVPVNGNICTGCHVSLPPQLIAEVKKREKIHSCNYCHRMLYARPS